MTPGHFFKVPSVTSDLFIRSINFDTNRIVYQIRDKETGTLLEPERDSLFVASETQIDFDNIRFINFDYAKFISQILI